jgi:sugar/nucleoside kinase (ribokinase family)
MTQSQFGLCAIGNAIVDVLAQTSDAFLAAEKIVKGSMTLIDAERADALYAAMPAAIETSGGSAANTIAGFVSLGGKAVFMGKVRDDQLGAIFQHDMRALGVTYLTPPAVQGEATARCLVMVTPDAQRSMCTYLGAAVHFSPRDIDPALVKAAEITYLEGYLFDRPDAQMAFFETVRIARAAGRKLALTLSDSFCVDRHRAAFRKLLESGIDILFANQEEVLALTETKVLDQALALLRDIVPYLVVTMSAAGAMIVPRGQQPIRIQAEPVATVVDTTGAGDQFAAGFLFGLTHGYDLPQSGRIAALAAAEVISHMGPRPARSLAELIKLKQVA